MPTDFRGVINADRTMTCRGVDYGSGIKPEVLHQSGDYYVVRVKGSTQWSGVGETEYYATTYTLCKKVPVSDPINGKWPEGYVCLRAVEKEREPGRFWRKCLNELKDEADRLAAEAKS